MSPYASFIILLTAIGLAAGQSYNCQDQIEKKSCGQTVNKWRFDEKSSSCIQFAYGGCAGNQNKFDSRSDCEEKCNKKAKAVTVNCNDPKVEGPCRAGKKRYYYNKDTKKCVSFFWGGCHPNGNNFLDEAACKTACVRAV
ncbi:hypothetical protein Ciccas_009832 [Cichlidogyrus casuarinus]|uniref:BPTI/Kunitz inhibitor domain-containing protein n=1 Tax=Cichlidogyrus casuarinus TaxID=1844966 RepID=A0ABD2PVY5_9PLAT